MGCRTRCQCCDTSCQVKKMKKNITQIVIWDNKAYVPSTARYHNGIYTNIEPIFITQPSIDELVPIVKSVIEKEPILLPDPSREEVKERYELLPKITGARNWKRLCQNGINYVIGRHEENITLTMSRLDSKGRWEYDPNKQREYPKDTPLTIVVQDILKDLAVRPK